MEEIKNRKKAKFAVALIIIGCFAVTVIILIVKPKYINKVEANNIYIGGFEKNILMKTIQGFTSNLKKMEILLQCKMIVGETKKIIMKMEPVDLQA